jgi:ADP-L-glycero-D-manno-heptose 6-epimerase
MIVVTGGAGFIGSCIVKGLNNNGINNIIIVDELDESSKWKNLVNLNYIDFYDKDEFLKIIDSFKIDLIIHMGACSSSIEKDSKYLMEVNYKYSRFLYDYSIKNKCRMIYASSVAVYGDGSQGYSDDLIESLKPLNMYGYTKKLFDQYCFTNKNSLPQCVGLRFFNVYGPNEYHKNNMSSIALQSYNQIKKNGYVNLFKSNNEKYKNGEQLRDFVYIKDIVSVVLFFIDNPSISGLFNVGSGCERTFYDVAKITFSILEIKSNIIYVDIPEGFKDKYQYFTKANITKLRKFGYNKDFYTIEEGIKDYILSYLNLGYKNY